MLRRSAMHLRSKNFSTKLGRRLFGMSKPMPKPMPIKELPPEVPVKLTPISQKPSKCLVEALQHHEMKYGDPAEVAIRAQLDAQFAPDDWQTTTIANLLSDQTKSHLIGQLWLQSLAGGYKGLTSLPKGLTAESLESFLKAPLPPGKSRYYSCAKALRNGNINSGKEHYHHQVQVPPHKIHGFRDTVAVMSLIRSQVPDYIAERLVAVSRAENNTHAGPGLATQVHVAPYLLPFLDAFTYMLLIQNEQYQATIKREGCERFGFWKTSKHMDRTSDTIILGSACGTKNIPVDPAVDPANDIAATIAGAAGIRKTA